MKVHRVSPDAAVPAGEHFFVGEVRVQPVVPGTEGIEIVVVRFSGGAADVSALARGAAGPALH